MTWVMTGGHNNTGPERDDFGWVGSALALPRCLRDALGKKGVALFVGLVLSTLQADPSTTKLRLFTSLLIPTHASCSAIHALVVVDIHILTLYTAHISDNSILCNIVSAAPSATSPSKCTPSSTIKRIN